MTSPSALLTATAASLRVATRVTRIAAQTARHVSAWSVDDAVEGVTWTNRETHVRRWSGALLASLGVRVLDAGIELPPREEPIGRMIVSNHRSMLDVLVLLARFGGHMLSRQDLAAWPVIGHLARRSETLFVDRSSTTSGTAAVRAMTDCLRKGRSVVVFPEGTTYHGDEVRPFLAGAFVAAVAAPCEIVPVGVAYAGPEAEYFQEPFGAHAGRIVRAPTTRVGLAVGAPMRVDGGRAKKYLDASHEAVRACVARARERVGPYAAG